MPRPRKDATAGPTQAALSGGFMNDYLGHELAFRTIVTTGNLRVTVENGGISTVFEPSRDQARILSRALSEYARSVRPEFVPTVPEPIPTPDTEPSSNGATTTIGPPPELVPTESGKPAAKTRT